MFHSDRGRQYSSAEFRALCDAHGVKQSMGKTGVCWDNALAESLFATYKLESHRASLLADPGSHTDGDRPLDRSRLQPPASALSHRHDEPRRLRGPILESPRSGLTQVFAETGQVHGEGVVLRLRQTQRVGGLAGGPAALRSRGGA